VRILLTWSLSQKLEGPGARDAGVGSMPPVPTWKEKRNGDSAIYLSKGIKKLDLKAKGCVTARKKTNTHR